MAIEYVGEHLAAGNIGNALVVFSFVSSLVAAACYFFSVQNPVNAASWRVIGRNAFRLHSAAVLGIVGTLFFMLFNHYFEYEYVWHHSNSEMPMRYILSCFWEGQEGSFLLWIFWQAVIGNMLIRTTRDWEAPVMATVSLAQVFLGTMLLGINILEYKLGSNPFTILLREHPDFAGIPLFQNPNYLATLDGRGLNPLLQNYWMTIHPPTLFLGFASTLVPFAYAIAGLWTGKLGDWQKPALPWTFFGVMVLGTGILMGGAWAYEALSFGGFWAWDPVENASLVPWLTFVAAAHIMIINKHRAGSLYAAFFFTAATYILVLYSTFLTRSGILGETSVHSFTDLGLLRQLLFYLLFFVWLTVYLLLIGQKLRNIYAVLSLVIFVFLFFVPGAASVSALTFGAVTLVVLVIGYIKFFPREKEEEDLWSREFWMFIGALVLLISASQLTLETSQPVWNKVFGTTTAPRKDVIDYYHKWQIPLAFLITLLIAVGQYFRFKNTDMGQFVKKISVSFVLSAVFTALICWGLGLTNAFYCMLLFSSLFATLANLDYFIRVLKGNVRKAGASLAHVGFGLIILGALVSTSKKEVISINTSGQSIETLGKDFSNNTNILLSRGDTLRMGDYFVTYTGKEKKGVNLYFTIEYFRKDVSGSYIHEFTLRPLVQTNPKMGNVAEPDTRHYLHKDVYTHVTYADLETIESAGKEEEYSTPKEYVLKKGDSIFTSNSIVIFEELSKSVDRVKLNLNDSDLAVSARLRAIDINGQSHMAEPVYVIRNNRVEPVEASVQSLGLKLLFWKINPADNTIEVKVSEKNSNKSDFIVMEAIIFPYINVLWMGCIIMIIGTVIAIVERIRKSRQHAG